MSSEIKRQAVKNILKEMTDNAIPFQKLLMQAFQEDWEEEKLQSEIVKLLTPEALSKSFDYYTNRIMSVFENKEETE